MHEQHQGGCHCGRVRYQFSGALVDIAHCHCSICRRVSGGLVTTWITLPRSAFAGAVRIFADMRAVSLF